MRFINILGIIGITALTIGLIVFAVYEMINIIKIYKRDRYKYSKHFNRTFTVILIIASLLLISFGRMFILAYIEIVKGLASI